MKELTHKDFFFCYTIELSNYLKQHGVDYLFKSRSIKDGSIFTLYQKTDKLRELLISYKKFQASLH